MYGVSHKGHVSKPPVPEEREANRLHGEAVNKKKDAAKQAATRKRERKEKHEKECKIALAEGRPRPARPESTEEEDSSDVELNFLDDDEVVMGAGVLLPVAGGGDPCPVMGMDDLLPAAGVGDLHLATGVGDLRSVLAAGSSTSNPGASLASPSVAVEPSPPAPR